MKKYEKYNEYNLPNDLKLTRSYIIDQPYNDTFDLDEALKKGVLFTNLYTPYNIATMENKVLREDYDE